MDIEEILRDIYLRGAEEQRLGIALDLPEFFAEMESQIRDNLQGDRPDREKIAEILEQPCDTCELEDNCDCRLRGIICPYQEKKADQIIALYLAVPQGDDEGFKVLVDGEWCEPSEELKDTVRSIDRALEKE